VFLEGDITIMNGKNPKIICSLSGHRNQSRFLNATMADYIERVSLWQNPWPRMGKSGNC
jgi:hypothetical protein